MSKCKHTLFFLCHNIWWDLSNQIVLRDIPLLCSYFLFLLSFKVQYVIKSVCHVNSCWLSMFSLEWVHTTSSYPHVWSIISGDMYFRTLDGCHCNNIFLKAIMVKQHTNSLDIWPCSQKILAWVIQRYSENKHLLLTLIHGACTKVAMDTAEYKCSWLGGISFGLELWHT